jgi:hypothetical protein
MFFPLFDIIAVKNKGKSILFGNSIFFNRMGKKYCSKKSTIGQGFEFLSLEGNESLFYFKILLVISKIMYARNQPTEKDSPVEYL